MSQFTGKQQKGAMRERRADKRKEAETRNTATEPTNRRRYRLALAMTQFDGAA